MTLNKKQKNYMKRTLLNLVLFINIAFLPAAAQDSVYLFSYFVGNGESGLHLANSKDGFTWNTINKQAPFLKPGLSPDKLMRDPCIIRGKDNTFHMVWTVSWTQRGIGYASSRDLVNWSEQKYIPVMEHEEKARNAWAAEITYDPREDVYMIYWATTIRGEFPETQVDADNGYNHRMYYVTTKDFETFSETKLLYDPGFNCIDATVLPYKNKWVMFLKDETRVPPQKNLKVTFADNLTGPYAPASEPITGSYWAEGPTVLEVGQTWIVYFDKYTEQTYGAVRSKDLKQWDDISDQVSFPQGARHGTVFKVSQTEFRKLVKEIEY